MSHVVVIGGSGMLAGLVLQLARDGDVVSVVARCREKLDQLMDKSAQRGDTIWPLSVDYHRSKTLSDQLGDALTRHGPCTQMISWIHDTNGQVAHTLANVLHQQRTECRYFEVLGSAAADPSRPTNGIEPFAEKGWIHYRAVILGFVCGLEGGRWLTHAEISQGVYMAVQQDQKRYVVGTVQPWSSRPQCPAD